MSKQKGWPTVSKGVFYKGFTTAQSPMPSERSMQTVKPSKSSPQTVKGRMVYPASSPLTAEGMRKPK